jgi:large subunit ribosomal protein L31
MQQGIHPKYETAIIHCTCGSEVETRSTRGRMQIDVCSRCHPFFTGEQRIVDTAGRVEQFNRRFNRAR